MVDRGVEPLGAVGHRRGEGDDVGPVVGRRERDVLQRDVGAEHDRVVARGEQQVAGHVEPDHVALALRREQQHPPVEAPALARRAARCSASTRSAISDARCSSATEISPGAHFSPTMNSAGAISSTSISAAVSPGHPPGA